ncbi:MAG: uncharacterized protein KVP18_002144 [Porospora cf. gigantea A]|uniref:uncharacterized protein n=1 Tax=Porospora cf. gigantea A TaxID=2853593 RepID=UPI00355A0211|nr:MAG: hypothetical protein KVP18_002144 [Porospora cf. gigantea A]
MGSKIRKRVKRSAKRKCVGTYQKDRKMHKKNSKMTPKVFKSMTDPLVAQAWDNHRGITENLSEICPNRIELEPSVPKDYTPHRELPMSTEQRLWAGKLLTRWGTNYEKMEKDRTRNPWQWREEELRHLLERYQAECQQA